MNAPRAYRRRDFVAAIIISAVLGWVAITAWVLMPGEAPVSQKIALLPWAAVIGLPIAFVACWAVAGPILWRLMQRPISWRRAAGWGALTALAIAGVGLVIDRINGWRVSVDPNSSYQIGGGDFVQEIDGVLTPYGWLVEAQGFLGYVLIGTIVALVVRLIIGPGSKIATTEPPLQ
jgi:hypothetical protein